VPTGLAGVAGLTQDNVPDSKDEVSPFTNPLYVTLFSDGFVWPYCLGMLGAVIVNTGSGANSAKGEKDVTVPQTIQSLLQSDGCGPAGHVSHIDVKL
jgi:hypothetical protein